MAPAAHQFARSIDNKEAAIERCTEQPQLERGTLNECEALDRRVQEARNGDHVRSLTNQAPPPFQPAILIGAC